MSDSWTRLKRGFWAAFWDRFGQTIYCGRCGSCGDAGCRCGSECDSGLFCIYPGIREETAEAVSEGWAAVTYKGQR